MKGSPPTAVTVRAPAKLNLGLEVLGRRPDGFHDLATIFLAVDLYDQIRLRPADALRLRCSDNSLAGDDNLVLRALRALHHTSGTRGGALVELYKGIPAAAGLGGASSDAAATLRAARTLWRLPISDARLAAIAAELGSDVPFFLNGGCALAHGRGERLETLPIPRETWFVVVVPPVAMANKTASLYAALRPGDFSRGDDVEAQAALLRAGNPVDPRRLRNSFTRALYAAVPSLGSLPEIMYGAGASAVALSGAGPAHYSIHGDLEGAKRLAADLQARLGNRTFVRVVAPIQEVPAHVAAMM